MTGADEVLCDIVLVVYDQVAYSRECVHSILANTCYPFRLIIVDNGSVNPDTRQFLDRLLKEEPERVRVIRNEINQGYVKAVNFGLSKTNADYVVVMSNDTVVYPGWLNEMITVAQVRDDIGIVNPIWECPGSRSGERDAFFKKHVATRSGKWIETDWARGFCYLTKRAVINKIGGLDLDFSPAYYDDWDYSMRAIHAGYHCVRALGSFVFHYKNVTYAYSTTGQNTNALLSTKGKIFYERWGRPLKILWCSHSLSFQEDMIRKMLKEQNCLRILTPDRLNIMHTNCKISQFPSWMLFFVLFICVLSDYRHSRNKRYHLIIIDEKIGKFFWMFLGIKNAYKIYELSDNNGELISIVQSLKSERMKYANDPCC